MQNRIVQIEEDKSLLKELYTSGAYLKKHPNWHIEESPWKAGQIMRMLSRHTLAPETIGEVGCGAGEILKQLQSTMDQCCTFQGYDISPQAIALAQSRGNERLLFKVADIQQERDAFFDLMLLMDVVEHIEDCYSFLRAIQRKAEYKLFHVSLNISIQTVLRKSGLLHVREEYGMVNHFTKELFLQMLLDAGYEILDYFYTTGCTDIPSKELPRNLMKYPRRIFFALNQDLTVRILGGYRLLVLAK